MALSNWDTLALDNDGAPCAGDLVTPMGVTLSIYKNWLYVYDGKSWRPGGGFVNDCVMQINEGLLAYFDLSIRAVRGPQDGVYVLAFHGSRWQPSKPFVAMAGCGVYGWGEYDHEHEFDSLYSGPDDKGFHFECCGAPADQPPYVGVSAESKAFLREHVQAHADELPEGYVLLTDAPWQDAKRFNQGDGYIGGHLDVPVSLTAAGEAQEPMMTAAMRPPLEEG